jgi:hypothetical protein
VSVSAERLARNQATFREVNARVGAVPDPADVVTEYVCECSDASCRDTIEIEPFEYEAIRSMPNVFAVVRGHEIAGVERVIYETDRFVLVEKHVHVEHGR